jgi:hypothetical protein
VNDDSLETFVGINENDIGIPFKLKDYLELVDCAYFCQPT